MMLGRLLGMLAGMNMMRVSKVGMMSRPFVLISLMVFRGFAVMARSVFVVLRCLDVMLCGFL